MSARKLLLKVHLYAALASGLLLSVTGASGTVLVFRHEIDRSLLPHLLRVEPRPQRASTEGVLAAVRRAFPTKRVQYLFPPTAAGDSYQVQVGEMGRRVYVDPHTGLVLGSRLPRETFTGFLYSLHADLLGGGTGRTVVGIAGGLLLLLASTGVILWWPGWRRLTQGFTVQWASGWKRVNFDLHRVLGIFAVPLLVLSAITGLALVFPAPFTWALHALTDAPPRVSAPTCVVPPDAQPLPLDHLAAAADSALPGARTTRISLAGGSDSPVVFRKKFPTEAHVNGMSFVHMDPYSGEVLAVEDVRRATAATRAMNLRYPLHVGGVGGLLVRGSTATAGLAPAALMTTGCMMWWNRTRARRKGIRAAKATIGKRKGGTEGDIPGTPRPNYIS